MKISSTKGRELASTLTRVSVSLAIICGPLLLDWQLNRAGTVREDIVQVQKAPVSGVQATQQATVVADKNSYGPNSTVSFTGFGFFPGETIDLVVTRSDWNKLPDAEFHTGAAIANPNGEFVAEWSACPGPCLDAELILVADGETSGRIASTTFRDVAVSPTGSTSPAGSIEPMGGTILLSQNQSLAQPAQVADSSQKSSDSSGGVRLTAMAASSYDTFFQLDGNVATAGGTGLHDWDQVYSDLDQSTTVSGSTAISFFNDPVPVTVPGVGPLTEDTYTGGNSKDVNDLSAWTYDSSGPQNKANLENAIAAAYLDPNNANHTYLYVAADRFDNSGAMSLGVWFLQTPVGQKNGKFYELDLNGQPDTTKPAHHVNGDLLLVADLKGGAATITSFKWSGGINGTIPSTGTTLSSAIGRAVVNTSAIQVPWPYKSSASGTAADSVQTGEFFEAGVDLNLLFPGQTTFNFSSFIVETRASTSPTATLSDFIVGHVSTAPDITVTKWADGSLRAATPANESLSRDVTVDGGATIGFTVTVANIGVGNINNATLTDPLPSGTGINWALDTANSSDRFEIIGTPPNQSLRLKAGTTLANNSLPISAHITSPSSATVTLPNEAIVGAENEAAAFISNNKDNATITVIGGGYTPQGAQSAVENAKKSFNIGTLDSATKGVWDLKIEWGDGQITTTTFDNTSTINVPSQEHTYLEEGGYTVKVTFTRNSVTKTGEFTVTVSDPPVIPGNPVTITKTYDSLTVGLKNLATFTDPGGAEPKPSDPLPPLYNHYKAIIDWGSGFGTTESPADVTISYAGTEGSASGIFTISASVPYKNVGTYHPVITIIHEDSTQGTLLDPHVTVTDTVTIDKQSASVTPAPKSKTYGDADPALTGTLTGFIAADGVTASYSRTSGETVAGSPYTISATLSPSGVLGNYDITYNTALFTINKRPASVTPASKSKVFGASDPVLTGTLSGFLAADGVTASYSRTPGETVAGSPYTISATLSPAGVLGNYQITYNTAPFTITSAQLVVTAENKQNNEGSPVQSLTYTVTLNGQSMPANTVSGSLKTSATGTSAPGEYSITQDSVFTAANYTIQFIPGKVTIADVAPTIVMSANNITLSLGDGFTRPCSFTDPGEVVTSETWTYTVNYGDGSSVSSPAPLTDPGSIQVGHTYASTGTFTVTVTVNDNYLSPTPPSSKSFNVVVQAP